MTLNPALRLEVLREPDPEEALRLLFSEETAAGPLDFTLFLEDAITAFEVEIEQSIVREMETVTLSLEHAELLWVALKTRKRPSGRPHLGRFQQATHAASLTLAERLAEQKRRQGIKPGKADEEAAQEASDIGGLYGATLSWTTIHRKMSPRKKVTG